MAVIFILIFISLLLAVSFLIGFIWAAKHGQFEDSTTPSIRILFDDTANSGNKTNHFTSIKTSNPDTL
ncbi:MAG: cbb3-type cytochrome oxidase assembly protein CcoS [Cytophagaceae bacterium]|nr:cbb3-type cytochrome oxidase assembly protein CcoS [Cytophagaceae bacterium]MDW8456139.1 cbb3-type cytochrome oxidase assembly protein CcoS [Cytophagaceae bacterium]